jgi:hypothetical protein
LLAGSRSRPRQVRKPIAMDAQFYTVRFEMIGATLSVYLDGELLGSVTDSSFAARGRVGLFTANKSFQIDDVHIGDPRLKPVQLTLDPGSPTWAAEAGDAPLRVSVTAVAADGAADSFSAESSNPAVVAVTQNGGSVLVAPAPRTS